MIENMEYMFIILQILFLLLTIIIPPNDVFLVNCHLYYRKYLKSEIITQGFCIVANLVIVFVMQEIVVCIFAIHIILTGFIIYFYSRKSKKIYYEELKNIIIENELQFVDSKKIQNYLLENYGKVYFVEDIEKCMKSANKNTNM